VRDTDPGELVRFFAARALGDRGRGAGRRYREDGDRRGCRDCDCKPTGNDQSSNWELEFRHRHAFCSFL
jgi:hypothetical protein